MKPLAAFSADEASRVVGLATDVDDTILDHGLLSEVALGALFRAHEAGFPILLATGRSVAFAEVLARMWPVVGAVAENGALSVVRRGRGLVRLDPRPTEERAAVRSRLDAIVQEVRKAFPEAELSDDVTGRISDVTFDIGETRHVPSDVVRAMVARAEALGARTTVSSVHLHLTLDQTDKASGILAFLNRERGVDPTYARGRWAYVGDSVNDAPAFAAFARSFGVANVASCVQALSLPPRYVASRERGAGFAELVARLLASWGGPSSS
jgi:hypothetical protein